ncbi:hypothetical protein MSAN_02181600 [Mycena sanguinolenta]|uniref:Uncharacterized protein n=1 Tax=Mycena sanguinolenta TaxID=230812 RepID=A0A8H6XFL8_9AGAR|nr:hypothetical protein MSAN_02181600 [Mycena sanguinolenta]
MLFHFRRKEDPWEVVDSKIIEPVHMYDEEEDLDVASVGEVDTCGTYFFNVGQLKDATDLKKCGRIRTTAAPHRDGQKGIQCPVVGKLGFDPLSPREAPSGSSELWRTSYVTYLLAADKTNVVLAARVVGNLPPLRPPPFMQVLQDAV